MKVFSILKQAIIPNSRPQEDYFIISKKYPIFVVADGVSLNFDNDSDYPGHSGAGEAAKIFCEVVAAEAEKRYETFKEENLKEIFELGNKAVLEYNISNNRTKNTINYYDFDLFSATTSFLLIKNNKAYWWSLCDAGLLAFRNGSKIFQSPDGWTNSPEKWQEIKDEKKRFITMHRDYRNTVNEKGELIGYGVVDGEEMAKLYLNIGTLDINAGDFILLYTDGFENYLNLKEFIELFVKWPENLENQLENIISEKSKENPDKYGREKTIIAVSI